MKVIHITAAAVWLGHKVLIPRDLERNIPPGGDRASDAVTRVDMAERVGQTTGALTLLSGVLLIVLVGGFDVVSEWIYAGAALVVLSFAIGATVARPAWLEVKAKLAAGEPVRTVEPVRRLRSVLVIESLLWVGALTTMFL